MLRLSGLANTVRDAGIPVFSLAMKPRIPDPRALVRFVNLIRAIRPGIIHSHLTQATLLSRLVKCLIRVPVVISTLHCVKLTSSRSDSSWARELAHRLTDKMSDVTTTICNVAGQRFVRTRMVSPDRLVVIPNGVDTMRFRRSSVVRDLTRSRLSLEASDFVWLAVGRFSFQKDYPTMLRAFAQLQCPTKLLISGSGHLGAEMRRLVTELQIEKRVQFLGIRNDVPELMNAADGFLLSSIFEGLPMVLLEAGACELPRVATAVGGNSEVISDGVSGLLAPESDPARLASAMASLIAMGAEERSRMGKLGRRDVVQKYGFDRIVDRWEEVYREAWQEKSNGKSCELR